MVVKFLKSSVLSKKHQGDISVGICLCIIIRSQIGRWKLRPGKAQSTSPWLVVSSLHCHFHQNPHPPFDRELAARILVFCWTKDSALKCQPEMRTLRSDRTIISDRQYSPCLGNNANRDHIQPECVSDVICGKSDPRIIIRSQIGVKCP